MCVGIAKTRYCDQSKREHAGQHYPRARSCIHAPPPPREGQFIWTVSTAHARTCLHTDTITHTRTQSRYVVYKIFVVCSFARSMQQDRMINVVPVHKTRGVLYNTDRLDDPLSVPVHNRLEMCVVGEVGHARWLRPLYYRVSYSCDQSAHRRM